MTLITQAYEECFLQSLLERKKNSCYTPMLALQGDSVLKADKR